MLILLTDDVKVTFVVLGILFPDVIAIIADLMLVLAAKRKIRGLVITFLVLMATSLLCNLCDHLFLVSWRGYMLFIEFILISK